MLDKDTVVFAAGNRAQLFNFKTYEQRYLQSTSGGGIGAITVSTVHKLFTISVSSHRVD